MFDPPLRTLVIGASAVAIENYLPFLAAQDDLRLTIYNRTSSKATEAANQFGVEIATDLDEAIAQTDLAFVLTTEPPRAGILERLISAGVPRIFSEKPFVAKDGVAVDEGDFREGARILSLATERGVSLGQQFNYRYMATVAYAHQLAADRDLGELRTFTAHSHYGCWAHVVDLVEWLAGGIAEVGAVESRDAIDWSDRPTRDLAATLQANSGAVGTLVGSARGDWARPLFRLELVYDRGTIRFSDFGDPVVFADSSSQVDETFSFPRALSRWDQYRASFAASLTDYLDRVRANERPNVDANDAVRELRLEAALRLSAAEQASVVLDERLPMN